MKDGTCDFCQPFSRVSVKGDMAGKSCLRDRCFGNTILAGDGTCEECTDGTVAVGSFYCEE